MHEQDPTEPRCPTCNSPHPHLHPAVQFEGEVGICSDAFHLIPTAQNAAEYREAVLAARRQRSTKE